MSYDQVTQEESDKAKAYNILKGNYKKQMDLVKSIMDAGSFSKGQVALALDLAFSHNFDPKPIKYSQNVQILAAHIAALLDVRFSMRAVETMDALDSEEKTEETSEL